MIKNSTYVVKAMALLVFLFAKIAFTKAQTASSPKLRFVSPVLYSGTKGQKGATYKFRNVISGVDAYVKIEKLEKGAYLVNIDDSTNGYYEAWQPTVGGPGTPGRSYIKWSIEFKTTSGSKYSFPTMDLSAIDIDGDNVKVREFVDVNGESSYDLPAVTLMGVSTLAADNEGEDRAAGQYRESDDGSDDDDKASPYDLDALGPVVNRTSIDTVATDVRINFHFKNKSKVTIITGSQVDNNGRTGAVAKERLNSLYFKNITLKITALPLTYRSFDVTASKNEVNLYWITDMEKMNDHFEIERSFDQKDFNTISLITASTALVGEAKQYNYKDAAAELSQHTVVYYRLKQVDADGKFTYSAIKMVRITGSTKPFVQVSPNPYIETLNVNFVSEEKGVAEIRLLSLSGQVSLDKKTTISKGYNNIQLSGLNASSAGIYMADILVNGKVISSQKLIKQ